MQLPAPFGDSSATGFSLPASVSRPQGEETLGDVLMIRLSIGKRDVFLRQQL